MFSAASMAILRADRGAPAAAVIGVALERVHAGVLA